MSMKQRDDADLCAGSGDFEVICLLIPLVIICITAFIITH